MVRCLATVFFVSFSCLAASCCLATTLLSHCLAMVSFISLFLLATRSFSCCLATTLLSHCLAMVSFISLFLLVFDSSFSCLATIFVSEGVSRGAFTKLIPWTLNVCPPCLTVAILFSISMTFAGPCHSSDSFLL